MNNFKTNFKKLKITKTISNLLSLIIFYIFLNAVALGTEGTKFSHASLPPSIFSEQLKNVSLAFFKTYHSTEYFSGMAVTVIFPGHSHPQIVSFYIGKAEKNDSQPINTHSLFQLGSLTKSYIAVILLKLAAEPAYHFSLDDPIDKFFPHFTNWRHITIRNLLNMTSGIPDYFQLPAILYAYANTPEKQILPEKWVNQMYHAPLLFKVGSRFHYSNTNYFLLGMLIEKLTGHSLQTEIRDRLLKPLKLSHTYYITHKILPGQFKNMTHGYQYEKGFMQAIPLNTDVTHYSLSYLGAAGAMIANSEEAAQWVIDLFTPGKIVTASQFEELTALISEKTAASISHTHLGVNDPYGYGLGVSMQYSPNLHVPIYIYQGMTFGYRSLYVYLPSTHILISILVNSSFDGRENHLLSLVDQIGALVINN